MSFRGGTTIKKPQRRGPKPPTPRLVVLHVPEGATPPDVLDVLQPNAVVLLGREVEGRDILLPDSRASRRHARLEVDADGMGVRIVDTSSNGTFVNGERVTDAMLADGDVIRLGDSFVLLRYVPSEWKDAPLEGILGTSPPMRALRHTLSQVGPTDATVLVLGESGTGKELVARALHRLGRPRGAFVAVNCGAIPAALAESQLFGHVRGSFTGASADHAGFFRAASGGTLFLDEIGELPSTLQPKLLRALEERTVVPVGGTEPIACDVRVVAATHRDLAAAVEEGSFRGDLYARLEEIVVRTPPLRARREDILPLLHEALDDRAPPLDPDLVEALLVYDWPFNVREVVKIARELSIRGAGEPSLELRLVEDRLQRGAKAREDRATEKGSPREKSERPTALLDRGPPPTREELLEIVRREKGNISKISRATGRSRKQVYRYLEEHGIDPAEFRS